MSRRFRDKFRHELKYLLNYADYALVQMRMEVFLRKDPYVREDGQYTIRSLYFDDYHNTAYSEKYQGVPLRQKFRIRLYNYSDQVIHLERKIKVDSFILKESAPLTRAQVMQILDGDVRFLTQTPHDLHKVFYHHYVSYLLRPRVVVDYEREPYIMDAGDVRVTFDKDVRAGLENFDIFQADLATSNVLPSGQMVMEVKYTEFLPSLVRDLLPVGASQFLAVSKYVHCCDQTLFRQTANE